MLDSSFFKFALLGNVSQHNKQINLVVLRTETNELNRS